MKPLADNSLRLQPEAKEKGCPTGVSVQKICKLAGNEKDVRAALDAIWKDPKTTEKVLTELLVKNKSLFRFEQMLEGKQSE